MFVWNGTSLEQGKQLDIKKVIKLFEIHRVRLQCAWKTNECCNWLLYGSSTHVKISSTVKEGFVKNVGLSDQSNIIIVIQCF